MCSIQTRYYYPKTLKTWQKEMEERGIEGEEVYRLVVFLHKSFSLKRAHRHTRQQQAAPVQIKKQNTH